MTQGPAEDASEVPRSPLPEPRLLEEVREAVEAAEGVVVLTGAGVSAESGVPTFRGPEGLWRKYRSEELATPEAFRRDPGLVWEWYEMRRRAMRACRPNRGHVALAEALLSGEDVTLVTQNVDGLHSLAVQEAGGPLPHPRILPLHGSIFHLRCTGCGLEEPNREELPVPAELPACEECGGLLRPAVVWFGEMLPERALSTAFQRATEAELCLVVGTSALVHPAASVPIATLRGGGTLVEVNPEPTPLSGEARWTLRGPAGRILPLILSRRFSGNA